MLPEIGPEESVTAAMMKIDADSLEARDGMQDVLIGLQKLPRKLKTIYLSPDTLFLLLYEERESILQGGQEASETFRAFQNHLE